ncbi:MAG: hypothetical protein LBJ08_00455 [Bifidobacteriaceae bacterium]|jgi:hypothetical protein|nr:hypothetical protein [Bifidobacteriaceae bacterium]
MSETETVHKLATAARDASTPLEKVKLLAEIKVHAHWAATEAILEIPREQRDWEHIARLVGISNTGAAKQMYDPEPWLCDTYEHGPPDTEDHEPPNAVNTLPTLDALPPF